MTHSESINELAAALSKAQGEMQAAIKDKKGVHNSTYADLGSVWDAARPVLSKYGLCVIQTLERVPDDIQPMIVTTLAHSSGQWIKSYIMLNPVRNDPQAVGSAITYFRRYSLTAILGIVCEDDDDGDAATGLKRAKAESNESIKQTPQPKKNSIQEKIGKQRGVAAKLGISTSTLHDILRKNQMPSLRLAYEIERYTKGAITVYDWIDQVTQEKKIIAKKSK